MSWDGWAGESGDHEAEVAGVGGAHDSGGSHNDGHVWREDPWFFEESGGEAEEGAEAGGSRGYELVVAAVVEAEADEVEERGREEETSDPGDGGPF